MTVNALSWNIITKMVTTVIIKLPRNGHPSAVRCSLFRIRSGIGLKHAMHACCIIICERLLKSYSNMCQERTGLPLLGLRLSSVGMTLHVGR